MTRKEPQKLKGDTPENPDPRLGDVTRALSGVDLPQDKEGLLSVAEENEADEDVILLLEQLPDEEYESMADILSAVSQIDAEDLELDDLDEEEEELDEPPLDMGDDEDEM